MAHGFVLNKLLMCNLFAVPYFTVHMNIQIQLGVITTKRGDLGKFLSMMDFSVVVLSQDHLGL